MSDESDVECPTRNVDGNGKQKFNHNNSAMKGAEKNYDEGSKS